MMLGPIQADESAQCVPVYSTLNQDVVKVPPLCTRCSSAGKHQKVMVMMRVYLMMMRVYMVMMRVYMVMMSVYMVMMRVYMVMMRVYMVMMRVYMMMMRVYMVMR